MLNMLESDLNYYSENEYLNILNLFITSNNKLLTLSKNYNIKISSEICSIMTSYVLGEYDENDTNDFIMNYYDTLTKNISNKNDILELEYQCIINFINEWTSSLNKNSCDELIFNILNIILTEIQKIITAQEDNNINNKFCKIITNEIWKHKCFRKVIKYYKKHNIGMNYITNSPFMSLFTKKMYTDTNNHCINYDLYIQAIDPLIKDNSIHDDLINYLHGIIEVNLPYTFDDCNSIKTKNCSPLCFNIFVMKILFKLLKFYGFINVINYINNDQVFYIKKYDINIDTNNGLIIHKLYLTTLFTIPICHIYVLKKYNVLKNKLSKLDQSFISKIRIESNKKKIIEEIKFYIELLSDSDNDFIQNIYLSYVDNNIYQKIISSDILNDTLTYFNYITCFTNNESFYCQTNKKIYTILSHITGGLNGTVKNVHTRFFACSLIFSLIKEQGFRVFDDLFENLFRYINEVDFFSWMDHDNALNHQANLVEYIYFLIDFQTKEIDGKRDMIAGTLFMLLKKSIKIFNDIYNICQRIKQQKIIVTNETYYFEKMVNVIYFTLKIHQNIYEKNIIKKIYPEVESKYSILIFDLLNAITDINHELYTVLKRPDLASNITKFTYSSINSHVNFCPDYLINIKDIIIDNLDSYSTLSKNEKKNIVNKLNPTKKIYDYPQEFLDPILCTEIIEPIKIPGINDLIFDKTSIITHIYFSKENPYTREYLTVDMLEEYNKRDDVVNDIVLFLEKKKEFEKHIKI